MIEEGFYNLGLYHLTLISFLLVILIYNLKFILLIRGVLLVFGLIFFLVKDFLIFFIILELRRVPIVFLTLVFGSQIEKLNSVYYLIFYSFVFGYLFLFLLLKDLYLNVKSFLVYFSSYFSNLYFFRIILIFLVKFPLFFLHFWLPKIHVEAPTVARILLAGLLLKFGIHGYRRFVFGLISYDLFFLLLFSIIGVFFGLFSCILQRDSKSLVAYSSIFHSNLVFLVYFVGLNYRKNSGFFIMLSHGFISSICFYFVGEVSHCLGLRLLYNNNGFFLRRFIFMNFFNFVFLINRGLPLRYSFFREYFSFLRLINFCLILVVFFYICLFFGFYYNIYLMIVIILGKNKLRLDMFLRLVLIFISYNINFFWL